MTHLASLTDEELLSEFRFRRDPITTTPMEEELAARLEAALRDSDELDRLEKEIEQMTKTNSDLSDQVRALEDKIADIKNLVDAT